MKITHPSHVDDAIDAWHQLPETNRTPLHEWLGWSEHEFADYVVHSRLPGSDQSWDYYIGTEEDMRWVREGDTADDARKEGAE